MDEIRPLAHRVSYFETDQMGIVHHSNYIRWFEDARTDYMKQRGVSYRETESQGVIMPVVSVACSYKQSAHFDELAFVTTRIGFFNGVRLTYNYEVSGENGAILATGTSEHCFLDRETRKPIHLRKKLPQLYGLMERLWEEDKTGGLE